MQKYEKVAFTKKVVEMTFAKPPSPRQRCNDTWIYYMVRYIDVKYLAGTEE